MKRCPHCAEDIQDAALVCKHCGREVDAAQPKRMGKGWKRALLIVFGVFLVLVIIGNIVDVADQVSDARPTPAAAPIAPASPATGVTLANYMRIETGMSYPAVVAILGKPGTEMSRNELAGTVTVMYQWEGRALANMNAIFQDDKLMQKAQFGLK